MSQDLEELRKDHLHVLYHPVNGKNCFRYKSWVYCTDPDYPAGVDRVIWNPVMRDGEGKITGYTTWETVEEALHQASMAAYLYLISKLD